MAFYLPQFHPIPENDAWWGKGFTEWTNVAKAKPLFRGHNQPRFPADFGYYDLRVPETRQQQADMARQYGIYGFCYYHYWFGGKRLLNQPLDDVLKSGKPDFPFCLCWANESWSRRWLGEEKDVLIHQSYSQEDDLRHAAFLLKLFKDKRYITVNGRPVFIIYRPMDLPDIQATLTTIRNAVAAENITPWFVASNSHCPEKPVDLLIKLGFDSVLQFRPQLGVLPNFMHSRFLWGRLLKNMLGNAVFSGRQRLYTYNNALHLMQQAEPDSFRHSIPCVFTGFDNTARRGANAIVMYGNTPDLFRKELERVRSKMLQSERNHDLFFINAWNEWAEGNYLEPDMKNGYEYLKAVNDVFGLQ